MSVLTSLNTIPGSCFSTFSFTIIHFCKVLGLVSIDKPKNELVCSRKDGLFACAWKYYRIGPGSSTNFFSKRKALFSIYISTMCLNETTSHKSFRLNSSITTSSSQFSVIRFNWSNISTRSLPDKDFK